MCFSSDKKNHITEPPRETPVAGSFDVVISGGGPAGVCAAISAARRGAKVLLLESSGCLGGILTSGLMSNIIDADNKGGVLREIIQEAEKMGMISGYYSCIDPEALKFILEKMVLDSGAQVQLYTRTVSAVVSPQKRLEAVITESASGREAFLGKVFIDATGNGDLAAYAGCRYELGSAENLLQATSLCALVYGPDKNTIPELVQQGEIGKKQLYDLLKTADAVPSYAKPTLFTLNNNGYLLMSNHQYDVSPEDIRQISEATLAARAEIWQQAAALRRTDPRLAGFRIASTGAAIGIREGRRINALYRLTVDDLLEGRTQPDPVCKSTFSVDIHGALKGNNGYTSAGLKVKPYDIPLRSLIAADVSGLLLAGRCISGDFYAHASYRVVGNAAPIGEAAGLCAALAAEKNITPDQVSYSEFLDAGGNPHPVNR